MNYSHEAVQNATDLGAISRSVINLSIGCKFDPVSNDAVKHATIAGMTVVVAAGNEAEDACGFSPGSAKEAITAGSIDKDDKRSAFSNWGSCVDIFAPGTEIRSAFIKNDTGYAYMGGTSMSSPHVAGLVTYLMAREPDLRTPERVKQRIAELATRGKVTNAMGTDKMIIFNGNDRNLGQSTSER